MTKAKESIGIRGSVLAEVKKFRNVGETPILVTDSDGAQFASGNIQVTTVNNMVTSGSVNIKGIFDYSVKPDIAMSQINDVLSLVDSNPGYSPKEKEEIKETHKNIWYNNFYRLNSSETFDLCSTTL